MDIWRPLRFCGVVDYCSTDEDEETHMGRKNVAQLMWTSLLDPLLVRGLRQRNEDDAEGQPRLDDAT